MDGDGADEIAVLIDDEIDGKRRLKIFQNDCWYLGPERRLDVQADQGPPSIRRS